MGTVAVAVSGGRDSIALLHSTLRHATALGLNVLALHVNHGLMPQADQWQLDLRRRCRAWARHGVALQLICERIADQPAPGDSVEAWARRVRYGALQRMALSAGCDTVLLAHHRRDQAETFLLQALRGGGVAGLAGMPAAALRDGIFWLRPWLMQSREAIDAYIQRHRLRFVEDASNADSRWARNRLREQVWPALTQAFPQAEQVLGDAARWAGLASTCLHELAEIDLARVADQHGLTFERWRDLSPTRRSNALRAWLQRSSGRPAPASLVERLLTEWPTDDSAKARGGRVWDWHADRIVARHGQLQLMRQFAGQFASKQPRKPTGPSHANSWLAITRTGRFDVPEWAGSLFVEPASAGGIPLGCLASLELRERQGGEQFQCAARRPPRSLKKQFQACEVPAWARNGPLIYAEGRLIHVAGLGDDARVVVEHGADLVSLHWLADSSV
ncbi:MAG: tRNA lysidine(34) synthetase TilS [Ideonella sp.]